MGGFKSFKKWLAVITVIVIGTLIGCSKDRDSGTSPTQAFDIVGAWGLTYLENGPSVNSSNSTWTFISDGTYNWFLLVGPYDLEGEGNYNLVGDTLFVDGIIANTIIANTPGDSLIITKGNNTFSFLDDDGDRWTYSKIQ